MGNTSTKEAREAPSPHAGHRLSRAPAPDQQQQDASSSSGRPRNRASRADLGSFLGISTHAGGSSSSQTPYERRETKQEREARRLERERQARLVERERSLKEEHVDGGYLVTLGTYVGPEDFSKPTVRQLQIERRLAPFWRGLNDFSDTWAEHQIIAVARGLPLPAANETPPEELITRPMSADSPSTSSHAINNLTVPIGGRSQSVASDRSLSGLGSTIVSPTSPSASAAAPATQPRNSSPFKHRPKALVAALSISSRNGSVTDIAPREIKLPHDPFVNGQPLEVFLYKDATECPICFLYYPPYLNHTRCCDQPICSECFVQIKRADPHYPDGHGDGDHQQSEANPEEQAGLLISEPACCPYCQQPELGVTYEPPPFRRGLVYSGGSLGNSLGVGALGTAMSSSSSLNSNSLSPTSLTSPPSGGGRRRTQSLSANAPNVITTDRVRPDWATKLAAQRAHIARRAAAATALHTAAFLMGNADTRAFRVGRFSRRNTGSGMTAQGSSSGGGGGDGSSGSQAAGAAADSGGGAAAGGSPSGAPAPSSSGRGIPGGSRRSRMEDLEEMMFAEAIRLSLAAEEERKRKAEKEERKEAKRKEKEERKAAKAAAKSSGSGPYLTSGSVSGPSSASGSTLSLHGLGLGRRRGNSAASNLRVEASVTNAVAASSTDKGKGVDRSGTGTGQEPGTTGNGVGTTGCEQSSSSTTTNASVSSPQPIPSPYRPVGPSHLRQMSSASSMTSCSLNDTPGGSFQGASAHLHRGANDDPRSSGLSLGSRSGNGSEHEGDGADKDPSSSTEPMFNFNSLAQMVGVQLEGEHAGRRLSAIGRDAVTAKARDSDNELRGARDNDRGAAQTKTRFLEGRTFAGESTNEAKTGDVNNEGDLPTAPVRNAPEVMVTPGTPAPDDGDGFEDTKQLGFNHTTTTIHQPRTSESVG